MADQDEIMMKGTTVSLAASASFTLSPTNGGAFGSYPEDTKDQTENDSKSATKETSKSDASEKSVSSPRVQLKPRVEQKLIPGTVINSFQNSSNNNEEPAFPTPKSAARSIRALPFEPLVHQRNLPKNGMISPLLVQEQGSAGEGGAGPSSGTTTTQPHRIPSVASTTKPSSPGKATVELSPTSRDPPVAEIRIPTPHGSGKDNEDADSTSHNNEEEQDFKTLFLCCQHELHTVKEKEATTAEENRMLKRHLIQLQKQLNTYRRNKRVTTASWTIPVSNRLLKRHRREIAPTVTLHSK